MLKKFFYIKIVRPENVWPVSSDKVKVRILRDIKLPYHTDADPEVAYEYHAGRVFNLERNANPFGYIEPWMVTDSGITGAAECWWRELVETGQAEIVFD